MTESRSADVAVHVQAPQRRARASSVSRVCRGVVYPYCCDVSTRKLNGLINPLSVGPSMV